MSANTPPNPYFTGINFNPSFFSIIQAYLTEAIANTKYLLLSGANYMTGNLGIKRSPAVELDVNGKAYINNFIYGVPTVGDYGGTSTRLILKAGSVTETPMALGVNSTDLWYGTHSIGNHIFYTGTTARMRILANGNIGIGTTTLISNILQVGDGGRLRISNSSTDSTSIGTRDIDDLNNTRIYLFANQHPTNPGIIEYISTSTGVHKFITGGINERMRMDSNGTLCIGTTTGTSGNTKLTISGSSTGYSQPLVSITQLAGWDGNYALQVTGYTNLGGFRINGGDAGNSFYQTLQNADFGFGQNPTNTTGGNIYFTTQGNGGNIIFQTLGANERLKIIPAGDIIIGGASSTSNKNIQFGSLLNNNLAIAISAGAFSTSAAIGDMVLRAQGKLLLQSGTGASAISINTNNYINIGNSTTVGAYPITLSTTLTGPAVTMTATYALAGTVIYNGNQTTTITPNINVGIVSTCAFNGGFYVYSDERIKKDIETIDNSLDLLNKINLVSFKYIDYIQKGNIKNYGVIAQEIEKVIPEVINKHNDFIPNIYKNVDRYDNDLLRLYIKYDDKFNLSIDDKIKIYDDQNKEHIKIIKDIQDDYITIDNTIDDYEEETPLFIYGKEVEDVKNVNYEALFIINMRATQELYKRLEKLEKYFNVVY